MPIDDGWDWPWLYYTGTVILNMSDHAFWRCSPRRLAVLTKVHIEANVPATKEKKQNKEETAPKGYIDQVLF